MIMQLRKISPIASATLLLALASPAAHATAPYNNIASSNDGTDEVFGDGPLAQSFNSGSGGMLNTVELLLTSSTTEDPTGLLQISLLSDNNTSPGSTIVSLGTLLNSAVPSGLQLFNFTASTPTLLAANTNYWIEISEATPNGIEWLYSLDQTATGIVNQSFYDLDFGVTADNAGYGAFQMLVDVPEPASIAAFGAGLLALTFLRRRRTQR